DHFHQLRSEGDRLSVNGNDRVAGFEPGAVAWRTGIHRWHARMHVGKHTDLANLEPAVGGRERRNLPRNLLTVALETDRDLTVWPGPDGDEKILPRIHTAPGDRCDAIAAFDARFRGRRISRDAADDR